jgi:hypothetical protein
VFGFTSPERPVTCSMVMDSHIDEEGTETKITKPVAKFKFLGLGYSLLSYLPQNEIQRKKFVEWTFTPVLADAAEHADMLKCANENRGMFHERDRTVGAESWTWPESKLSTQQLVSFETFDPESKYLKGGAHMPVMLFIGAHSDTRRSPEACGRREAKAEQRGYGVAQRKAKADGLKGKGDSTRGDGAKATNSKGGQGTSGSSSWGNSQPSGGWTGRQWNESGEPWSTSGSWEWKRW